MNLFEELIAVYLDHPYTARANATPRTMLHVREASKGVITDTSLHCGADALSRKNTLHNELCALVVLSRDRAGKNSLTFVLCGYHCHGEISYSHMVVNAQ